MPLPTNQVQVGVKTSAAVRIALIASLTLLIGGAGLMAVLLTNNDAGGGGGTTTPPQSTVMKATLQVSPATVLPGQDFVVTLNITAPPVPVYFFRGFFSPLGPTNFESLSLDTTATLTQGWSSKLVTCPSSDTSCGSAPGAIVSLVAANGGTRGSGAFLRLRGKVAANAAPGAYTIDLQKYGGTIFGGLTSDQYTITPTTLTVNSAPPPMEVTMDVTPKDVMPGQEMTITVNITKPPKPFWHMLGYFDAVTPTNFARPTVDLTGTLAQEGWASTITFCPGDPLYDCGDIKGTITALLTASHDISTAGTFMKLKARVSATAVPGLYNLDLTRKDGWPPMFGGLSKSEYRITPTTFTISRPQKPTPDETTPSE